METSLFSPLENQVIKALGNRTMSLQDIAKACYKSRGPLYPRTAISVTVRRINQKCEYHKLCWFINGAGQGRPGREVWRDKSPPWRDKCRKKLETSKLKSQS